MHTAKIQVLGILGSLALLVLIFELLRKRRLREEYAILWLGGGLACLLLAIFRDGLKWLAQGMGIYYPPAAIFLVLMAGAYAMILHFSLGFSKIVGQSKELAQEVALLRLEVERLGRTQPAKNDRQ